ncbi:MAG TPA: ribosome biogenesis GTPase YlqF [Stenomitos sp.]
MTPQDDELEEKPSSPYPTIQWFPGHIAKAQRELKERLKIIDFVLELVDARIPESSRFGQTTEIFQHKPVIVVFTKSDLADPERTKAWIQRLRSKGIRAVALNAHSGEGISALKQEITRLNADVQAKMKARGRLPRPARVMVVGLPNVGKSSLINRITRSGKAKTGDKPGVTRAPSWIRIGKDLELMDTPGIIPPKLEDPIVALKLAITGAVSTEAYDPAEVARFAIGMLQEFAPDTLTSFGPAVDLEVIGKKRGILKPGGHIDPERTARNFLADLRTGALGPMTLDVPPAVE